MKCDKCNRDIPIDSGLCPVCGNKIEEKKTINISLKKTIIGILGILVLVVIILSVVFLKKLNNFENKPIDINYEKKTEVYERNKVGLFKGPNILEERYNDKGDLIYCKYMQGDEQKENEYDYTYDSKNRVIKIVYNDNVSTFLVNYNNEDKISEITTGYELGTTRYIFHYNDDLIIAEKFINVSTSNYSIENKYNGLVTISEKEIDGKNYVLLMDSNENDILEEILIYEKNNENISNSFAQYSFLPLQYINIMSDGMTYNVLIDYTGFASAFLPIFNYGNEIYNEKKQLSSNYTIQEYEYDKDGRLLLGISNLAKYYYKYENINENSFYGYILTDGISEDNYQALGMKSQYLICKNKFYLDDEDKICKCEKLEENIISSEEFQNLKDEYIKYIDENRTNSQKIRSEFSNLINTDIKNTINYNSNESDTEYNSIQENATELQSTLKEEKGKTENNSLNNKQGSTPNNNSKHEKTETDNSQQEKKDTSFKMTSIQITSSLNSNTEYYTLRGKVNLTVGKDADLSKYSNFVTTINGKKVSSNGDTIYDGYMWFYESYNPLSEGENKFDITVTDADGKTISKSITVTYIPE